MLKHYNVLKTLPQDFLSRIHIACVTENDNIKALVVDCEDEVYAIGKDYKDTSKPVRLDAICKIEVCDFSFGRGHVATLTKDGRVFMWGQNASHQCGNGENEYVKTPTQIHFQKEKVKNVLCGWDHTLALTESGSVYTWGRNISAQCGTGSRINVKFPEKLMIRKVKSIACGAGHSLVLLENGQVYGWGENGDGQLGIGRETHCEMSPALVSGGLTRVKKIVCGSYHTIALSTDGCLYTWGYNDYGQLGLGHTKRCHTPQKLESYSGGPFTDVAALWCKDISVAFKEDDKCFIWGQNSNGDWPVPTEIKANSFNDAFALHVLSIPVTFERIYFEKKVDDKSAQNELIHCTIGKISFNTKNIIRHLSSENIIAVESILYENGKFFNNFIQLDKLGEGSFGYVLKARQNNITYAVKLIQIEDRFKTIVKEVKILSSLKSEFIIKYESSWLEENKFLIENLPKSNQNNLFINNIISKGCFIRTTATLFLQMELGHRTLDELIKQINIRFHNEPFKFLNPISYFIASEIFREIVESVNYLQEQKPPIIHRDIKPQNILITNGIDGRFAKIGDFGLATHHEYSQQTHTEDRGTIQYIAPEVIYSEGKYGPMVDIYSLGVILPELFNFKRKIDGVDEDEVKSCLREKYLNLISIGNRMRSVIPDERPKCKSLLKENVYMDKSELENSSGISEFLQPIDYYTDNFFELFIQKKMNHPNYELALKSINNLSYFIDSLNNGRYEKDFTEFSLKGLGGFSVVYEACSNYNNKNYAIKKIPIRNTENNLDQLRREWNFMFHLKEDNFVKYISAWTEENKLEVDHINKYKNDHIPSEHPILMKEYKLVLYIQMELCYNSLDVIKSELNNELNPFGNQLDLTILGYYIRSEILLEIFEAIEFLHKSNITHRDLKPQNILIANESYKGKFVKIGDFGSAKVIKAVTQNWSPNTVVGTHRFMAPEVYTQDYDMTADIYSLGLTTKDLFNTDLTKNIVGEIDDRVNGNYRSLIKLCKEMTEIDSRKRPNWDKLNLSKSFWKLTLEDIQNENEITELRLVLDKKRFFHNIFYLRFMDVKLNYDDITENSKATEETLFKAPIKTSFQKDFLQKTLIDCGNFSLVFKVKDNNNKYYAIKRIPVEKKYCKIMLNNLKILEKLKNDFVINYFNFWDEENEYIRTGNPISEIPYSHLVFKPPRDALIHVQMELCDETLQSFLDELNKEFDPLNISKIRYYIANELFYEILSGLNYLHKCDPEIVHSNLSLTNILISSAMNGKFIKISDVGHFTFQDYKEMTMKSLILRKYKYIDPELFYGNNQPNINSDIYSAGIILEDLLNTGPGLLKSDTNRQQIKFEDEALNCKFQHLLSVYENMRHENSQSRPNIDEILQQKRFWALHFNQIMDQRMIEQLTKIKFPSEKVHLKFLQIKQRFPGKDSQEIGF